MPRQVDARRDPFDLLDVYKYSANHPHLDHHKNALFLCQEDRENHEEVKEMRKCQNG